MQNKIMQTFHLLSRVEIEQISYISQMKATNQLRINSKQSPKQIMIISTKIPTMQMMIIQVSRELKTDNMIATVLLISKVLCLL